MKKLFSVLLVLIVGFILITDSTCFSFGKPKRREEPKYYSFEDLRSGLSNEYFYFANINKPTTAFVDLGYFPLCSATASKMKYVTSQVSSNPSKYAVNSARIYSNWNDSVEIIFEWSNFRQANGRRGDLIFTRGFGKAADLVKKFSNWTHVAIVESIYDCTVFESTPDTGVNVNNTKPNSYPYTSNGWSGVTYYTCKQIMMDYNTIISDLNNAEKKYKGLKYFPSIATSSGLQSFIIKWSDKKDQSSMYCSKLVYNTFKYHLDFDSNNTNVFNVALQERPYGAHIYSWIGVSPDDIYYSSAVSSDFCYSQNLTIL